MLAVGRRKLWLCNKNWLFSTRNPNNRTIFGVIGIEERECKILHSRSSIPITPKIVLLLGFLVLNSQFLLHSQSFLRPTANTCIKNAHSLHSFYGSMMERSRMSNWFFHFIVTALPLPPMAFMCTLWPCLRAASQAWSCLPMNGQVFNIIVAEGPRGQQQERNLGLWYVDQLIQTAVHYCQYQL